MIYYTNEIIFDLPSGLMDKTHHIFTVTQEGPSEFTVVISRNVLKEGDDIEKIADRLPQELKANIPTCNIIKHLFSTIAGKKSLVLEYSFIEQGKLLLQRQVSLINHLEDERPLLIQITGTAVVDALQPTWKPEWASMYQQIYSSIKLLRSSG